MNGRASKASALVVVGFALLYQLGCGGGSSSPVSPAPPPSGGGGNNNSSALVTIVGINGSQSFAPDPVSVEDGGTIDFRNSDSTTHHIVADNGAFDTGNLTPGATSAAMTIHSGQAIQYHCTIHPSMVGAINGSPASGPSGPGY